MAFCINCGNELEDGVKFCPNCGTPTDGNVSSSTQARKKKSKKGILIAAIVGAIALISICGVGWWLMNNKANEQFETTLVSFKKTAPSENIDVESEINVDFPIKGNSELIKKVTMFLIDALSNDFKNDDDVQSPHYEGDISDGQAIVDFYGNEKIKELQKQGIGDATISIKKTFETDKILSYTVDFGGCNGGVGFGTKHGVSFNKADGTIIQVIRDPNDGRFKEYLISKVTSHLKENDGIEMADLSELKAHPYPQKAPYLTKDGVCFVYQKYEIGAGALGEVELTIPYNAMKPYMSDAALSYIEINTNVEQGDNIEEKDNSIVEEKTEYIDDDEEVDTDWLQGHWVYEQGSYKGHFIIQGDKITQYSSMNPERETSTFSVEGDEIVSRIANGVNLTVKIDFDNQTIDYGDGCWMHKINSSSGNDYSSNNSNTSSSSRTFYDEQIVVGYLANQTFRSSDGFTIRFDGSGRMYAEGDFAGVVSVLTYNSKSALLRYGGGIYTEGKIRVDIVGSKLQLTDPTDGTVYYQR